MNEPILMQHQDKPFNGDGFICKEFLSLKNKFKLNTAIETGSCFYVTSEWLGNNFEQVFTCEINYEYAKFGLHRVENMPNVKYAMIDSVSYIRDILPLIIKETDNCIYFLDAHWNDFCPLLDEINLIGEIKTNQPPIIAIHDFYTGNPEHGHDTYHGQPFTYEWIEPSLKVLESKLNCKYEYYYNSESEGANRGIIYLTPKKSI
jgi:hypothetical protein